LADLFFMFLKMIFYMSGTYTLRARIIWNVR
jgi:hypothetical protein